MGTVCDCQHTYPYKIATQELPIEVSHYHPVGRTSVWLTVHHSSCSCPSFNSNLTVFLIYSLDLVNGVRSSVTWVAPLVSFFPPVSSQGPFLDLVATQCQMVLLMLASTNYSSLLHKMTKLFANAIFSNSWISTCQWQHPHFLFTHWSQSRKTYSITFTLFKLSFDESDGLIWYWCVKFISSLN